jgi:enterochelin esterase-like enzyme
MSVRADEHPPATGPVVDHRGVLLRLPDAGRRLVGVRLWQEVRLPGNSLDFTWRAGQWSLRIERPPVWRMEYLFELRHVDGGTEMILDPGNERRVGGAFGEHSVIEFPDYRPPGWLAQPCVDAVTTTLEIPVGSVRSQLRATVWAPERMAEDEPAPLLVVHDGPEYAQLAGLLHYLGAGIRAGTLPSLRAALLDPGPRDAWYSANRAYARGLALAVLPALRTRWGTTRVVGMGASLGALSWLHAQHRHPGLVDGLFLQSGTFFHHRLDAHEHWFHWHGRVVAAVGQIARTGTAAHPVAATLTCGAIEENVGNNRLMARALAAQGYRAHLVEVPDVHNYTAWRDAFAPHLTELLTEVVGR